ARVKANPKDAAVQIAAARWYVDHGLPQEAIAHYDAVRGGTAAQRTEAWAAAARLRRHVRWKQELIAEKLATVRADPEHATVDDLAIATIDSGVADRDIRAVFAAVLAAQTDPERVNNLVYSALAAGANGEALAAAKKMTESRNDGQHLDTLAECYHVAGDQAEALRVEDSAIAMAKGSSLASLLVANRARFAAGAGKSREVTALDDRVAALWKQLETADQLAQTAVPTTPTNPVWQKRMEDRRKRMFAEMDLGGRLAKACRGVSGSAEEAHVRVRLDDKGHVTSSVLLLEPGATEALRKCLTTEVGASALPVVAGEPESTVIVSFRHLLHTP
ncbi:MAG TPA: hypothetical protein VMJ10_10325, partial [Kofleriaceae bacterium]|nr:hypothetical protein [Kofleriaceae bacterium]